MTASSASNPVVATLSRTEMQDRARAFAKEWKGPQREEADAKTFVDKFFQVFGRDRHQVDARFEFRVTHEDGSEGRIDLIWPGRFLIEMKSTGRDLSTGEKGAAGQAFKYVKTLDPEDQPRWVMVSDFTTFVLYDLGEEPHDYLRGLAPAKAPPKPVACFLLENLAANLKHFAFIRDEEQALFQTEPDVNLKAVAKLSGLHEALKKEGYSGHRLERLLVRVLFCLFAEDTDIFPWNSFTRYVEKSKKDGSDLGRRLSSLFEALDIPHEKRQAQQKAEFAAFPYVNGGLFAERIDTAYTTAEQRDALIDCCRFNWSAISPSVFGSLFQGVMEDAERRAKGAHYTSEENIRKVVDPLFLDDLKAEFQRVRTAVGNRLATRKASDRAPIQAPKSLQPLLTPLEQFHERLAALRFLDPACGCGNFLVVAYRELRSLELEVLRAIYGDQLAIGIDVEHIAKVNVDQFYGIEMEEFPALIAETAMWLTDHQVNIAFSKAFGRHYVRIPLKKTATIHIGNALRVDWRSILPPGQCSYILGNPPYGGQTYQSPAQKEDQKLVLAKIKAHGVLDYVCNWYLKAADYIQGTHIRCAFVSTNSITQGEQAGILWHHLFSQYGIKIHFAHRTFIWANEARGNAHVHVVIIGFAAFDIPEKRIYEHQEARGETLVRLAANVSPYLVEGPDRALTNLSRPICAVPKMSWGNKPSDGGFLILSPAERTDLLAAEPQAAPLIRRYMSGGDFLNNGERYCFWLKDADRALLRRCPRVLARIESVRQFREQSDAASTREYAKHPTLFRQIAQPSNNYLAVPETSSEGRAYIPMAYVDAQTICSNTVQFVPGATLFHFGVLSSAMHMAWVRQVAGRLKSDPRYSNTLVYNNYPWPSPTPRQQAAIERAAQAVLDARAPHLAVGASLAQLYEINTVPDQLVSAHQALDQAVDRSYRAAVFATDSERFQFLFSMHERITSPTALTPTKRSRRASQRNDS